MPKQPTTAAMETSACTDVERASAAGDCSRSDKAAALEFQNSTYQYLIYGRNSQTSCCDVLVAAMVLVTQLIAYSVVMNQVIKEIDEPSFVLKTDSCDNIAFANIACDKDEWEENAWAYSVGFICVLLLTSSMLHDLVASVKTMAVPGVRAKVVSLLILLETCFAILAGWLYAGLSMIEGNSANAIVNCVAVLFLHDMDEKMFIGLQDLKTSKVGALFSCKCCAGLNHNAPSVCFLLALVAIFAICLLFFFAINPW